MAIASVVLLAPERARACNPCTPEGYALLGDDAAFPANGLVVTTFADAEAVLDAHVDGEAATLEPLPIAWPLGSWWTERYVWRVAPEPVAGALLEITSREEFHHCLGSNEPPYSALAATIVAADAVAPESPGGLTFDIHTYPTYDSDATCGDPPESMIWLHGTTPPDPAPRSLRAEVHVAGEPLVVEHHPLAAGALDVGIAVQDWQLGEASIFDACVRVQAIDPVGNLGPAAELCLPCHVRQEPQGGEPHGEAPDEPHWTAQDEWPAGSCVGVDPVPEDDPGTTSGGDTTSAGDEATSGDPPSASTGSASDGSTGAASDATTDASEPTAADESTSDPAADGVLEGGCGCAHEHEHERGLVLVLALAIAIAGRVRKRSTVAR